jgi:hypothetical protein
VYSRFWVVWLIPAFLFIGLWVDHSMVNFGGTIDYGILIGLVAIGIAIYLSAGSPIRDFLREIKRGSVDEKIAMLYGYILSIPKWRDESDKVRDWRTKRICADIRAIGKIKASIHIGQKEDIYKARDELVNEMRSAKLIKESEEIDRVFRLHVY